MTEANRSSTILVKTEFRQLIESFVFKLLEGDHYEIRSVPAEELMTWNRLDLALKLLYLDLKDKHNELAQAIYRNDIRSQTLGTYREFGNSNKNSFNKYLKSFDEIYESIRINSFDETQSLVPVSATGAIFNGAHRVASAIRLGRDVRVVQTELPNHVCDYRFYQQNGVPIEIIELAAVKFISHADDVYLAFLWPSGESNIIRSIKEFDNILYSKNIHLNANGARNLLYELYKHMDWVGSRKNGYSGLNQKLAECFAVQSSVRVIAFQAKSIDEVRAIKERVRAVNGIGFSSVHITDTKEEAVRISNLVFNANGLHFLNFAKIWKFDVKNELLAFRNAIQNANLNLDDVAIDGSFLLALYGLRSARDLDFLSLEPAEDFDEVAEQHDTQLIYHRVKKHELICDPRYHFVYSEMKFISFQQLLKMKTVRNEDKDRYDISLMSRMFEERTFRKLIQDKIHDLDFAKIRLKSAFRRSIVLGFKQIGVYDAARRFYWKWMK